MQVRWDAFLRRWDHTPYAAMVRNEVDCGALLLTDSSGVAARPSVSFAQAVEAGRTLLNEDFDYMVDVA